MNITSFAYFVIVHEKLSKLASPLHAGSNDKHFNCVRLAQDEEGKVESFTLQRSNVCSWRCIEDKHYHFGPLGLKHNLTLIVIVVFLFVVLG